jgi:cyclopropane fatty-acyl-phospholipid synthase-like methyltransferase
MFDFHTNRHAYHQLLHNNAVEQILPFILKEIIIGSQSRVLEIGSGDGGNLSAFLSLGCTAVGVELDASLVDFTKEKLGSYLVEGKLTMLSKDIYDADIEKDLGGKFDLVILKDVIEHIHDQPKLFRRMKEMLNGRGMIFFQPFDDGRRLDQHLFTGVQRGHHLLGVDRFEGFALLFIDAQVHSCVVGGDAFEVERNAQTVRGAASEKTVELHGFTPLGRWSMPVQPRLQRGR